MFLKEIKNYIQDNTFKMIIKEEYIYINHFKRINLLETNHISITTQKKRIHIYGLELKPQKMVNHEILIKGQIEKIEVQNER